MIRPTKIILTLIITCLFLQSGYAIQKEVIAEVGGRPITNIDVFESVALVLEQENPLNNSAAKTYMYKGEIEDMLPIILFEQYAAKNGIKITEQEIVDSLAKTAKQRGRTLAEDIQKSKSGFEDFENARKRRYKQTYDYFLDRKVVEHYNPDVNNVTEEDIQKWIPYRKTFHAPMGEPEQVQYRGIAVLAANYANSSSVREELDKIKKRINGGESFETVAKDYSGRKEYRIGIGHQPNDWVMTNIFEKQGFDALTAWSSLKGKAVIAKVKEIYVVMVMKVEDYQPDTQMSIEDALKDKNLRQVCIGEARGYKFTIQRRDLIKKLELEMGGVKYRGNKDEICQKMANQYKQYISEVRKIDPNS